jgi:outer membrane immunogenic protein
MKKFVLAAVGMLALGAAPVAAADLGPRNVVKAPPMETVSNWTGFYLGANGGGAWSRKCWDDTTVTGAILAEGCHTATGGLIGGQLGYRWQAGTWVFGVEAQSDWGRLRGSAVSNAFVAGSVTDNTRIDGLALFTGQVGMTWGNTLLYVKGGAAAVRERYEHTFTAGGATINSANEIRWGAALGTGIEYAFSQNWSIGLEYDHLFMGTRDLVFTSPVFTSDRVSIKQDVDMLTARINYRFDNGPVVARY